MSPATMPRHQNTVPPPHRTEEEVLAARALLVARRTALGVLGDHAAADDVAQEVAITVLRRVGELRDPDALDGWIHRIATRRALKEARRAGTRRAAETTDQRLQTAVAAPSDTPAEAAGLDAALALLQGLSERARAAMTLRYVHDLTDEQIADALGCRTGTVRSLLSRGRRQLRATTERTTPATPTDTSDSETTPC